MDPNYIPNPQNPQPLIPQAPIAQAPQPAANLQNTVIEAYPSNPFVSVGRTLATVLNSNTVPSMLAPFIYLAVILVLLAVTLLTSILHIPILPFLLGIIFVGACLVGAPIFVGTYLAIVAASLDNKAITTKQAISIGVNKLLPLIGFYIVYMLASLLGYILLIIPGIIISTRGSLGPILIFEENLGPIVALKRSFALTKGHFFETFSTTMAGALFCAGGLLAPAMSVVPIAARYKDFKIAATQATKQAVHWINYVLAIVGIIAIVLYGALFIFALTRPKDTTRTTDFNSSSSFQSDSYYSN